MISVVMPVHNAMPWLDAQLDALASQVCDEPWEVVVADNGSTDGSVVLARSWEERCGAVRVLDASATPGPAAARNAGVREARGELLAFCDADDVVQPGWLKACVEALGDADVVAGTFDLSSLNAAASAEGAPAPAEPAPAATSQLGFLPAGLAANLAVRREAFGVVGGFDEQLFVGEDIDLCWRLQLEGFLFAVAPAPWWPSANVTSWVLCSAGHSPTGGAARCSTAGTGAVGLDATSPVRRDRGHG